MPEFDDSQLEAIESDAKKLLVLAGAGTGKTTMLLGRVAHLIRNGADPKSILALTFTNAAACEMRDRFKREYIADAPLFATFHAFCYRLILHDPDVSEKLGYRDIYPTVATESDELRIRTKCRKELNIRLSDRKLDGLDPITAKDQFYYNLFWKRYRTMLRNERLITFDIMCKDVCELFTKNDSSILKYKDQYQYIFVDEFQDTDRTQWRFVCSFKDSCVAVVGDAKQNLYRFRGCSNDIIKGIAENDSWKTVKLYHNYRSTKPICEFANGIHEIWGDTPYNLKLESMRDGAPIEWKQKIRLDGNSLADDLIALTAGMYDGKSIAILCRTNAEVDWICSKLSASDVKYTRNRVYIDREHILKSAFDDDYFMSWVPTNLQSKEYGDYIKSSYLNPEYQTISGFINAFGKKLSPIISQIERIKAVLRSDMTSQTKHMQIGDIIGIRINGLEFVQTDEDILKSYLKAIRDGVKAGSIYVGTIHSVKGLEYDTVHVINVDGKYFQLNNEDNLNCYYVACTRAKEHLTIWMGEDDYEDSWSDDSEFAQYRRF